MKNQSMFIVFTCPNLKKRLSIHQTGLSPSMQMTSRPLGGRTNHVYPSLKQGLYIQKMKLVAKNKTRIFLVTFSECP